MVRREWNNSTVDTIGNIQIDLMCRISSNKSTLRLLWNGRSTTTSTIGLANIIEDSQSENPPTINTPKGLLGVTPICRRHPPVVSILITIGMPIRTTIAQDGRHERIIQHLLGNATTIPRFNSVNHRIVPTWIIRSIRRTTANNGKHHGIKGLLSLPWILPSGSVSRRHPSHKMSRR